MSSKATQILITEKPKAAETIAEALAEGKVKKHSVKKVPYFEIERGGKKIIVCCAVGHLYNLAEIKKKGLSYPVFDVKWTEAYNARKGSEYTRDYIELIKKLSRGANEFVIACDYDVEGEVIGWNAVRFACGKKDAFRMKFSTLTKDELVESYEKMSKHINWGQAHAGETRHYLDYFYGINLSRALTDAIKTQNAFKIMSSGRVQGPALKIIVEREKEIRNFKPEKYWQIEFNTKDFSAWHTKGKFKEKPKFKLGNTGAVESVDKREFIQKQPFPFDLTSLQIEAYNVLGISPKECLRISQALYVEGYISYPRTSSQKLPIGINYRKIINGIGKQENYRKICDELMLGELKPNEGGKTDPAHPAIYPTGIKPKKANKIYDLIAHRFLACFGKEARREACRILIDVNGEKFAANGVHTIEAGWHRIYGKYLRIKEEKLPELNKGDKVKGKAIVHEKETEPPNRFNQASIIKKLESLNLGTKATRAAIVDALYQRNYVAEKIITATEFGIKTIEVLDKYCPDILDAELTKLFEEEMEEIREGKKNEKEILEKARDVLTVILKKFKKHEKNIGKELLEAFRETQREMSIIGDCPKCKEGKLAIRRGKFGLFAACNKYPKCKTTFSLPKNALIKPAGSVCKECGYPEVIVIRAGKRPWKYCINLKCKIKESWGKKKEKNENKEEKKEENKEVKTEKKKVNAEKKEENSNG